MITDAVLHEELLTAALPAAVVLDSGTWRPWVSQEPVQGILYAVSDSGAGTIGVPYDTIPDIPESVMLFSFEFVPDDIGEYWFIASPAPVYQGEVLIAELTLSGTGIWNDRTISAVPSELSFLKTGSVMPAVQQIELSVDVRKAVLDTPEGESSSSAFEVEAAGASRILQPEIIPAEGIQYYLREDGSITTNPINTLGPIAYGYSGKWKIGSAPSD